MVVLWIKEKCDEILVYAGSEIHFKIFNENKKNHDICDCPSHSSWRQFPSVQLCCVIIFIICRAMGPWSEGI